MGYVIIIGEDKGLCNCLRREHVFKNWFGRGRGGVRKGGGGGVRKGGEGGGHRF